MRYNKTAMMRTIMITLIFAACSTLTAGKKEFPQDKNRSEQKEIIARLTGHTVISGYIKINDRNTQENKKICIKYLSSLLEIYCSVVSVHTYSRTGNNIYGIIPSTTGSSEYLIIGAHYDGIPGSPGANDNATGVAAAYSIGEYIAHLEYRRFSTIIIFFDEEEKGLVGSRAFAAKIRDDSLTVHSVHTIDQMGWDNDGDRAIELELPSESLKELYFKVASESKINFPIHITKVGSTDHSAFRRMGFNAIGITEEYQNRDTTPHFHKSTDSYTTVNFEYLQNTTSYLERVFKYILEQPD